MTPLVRQIRAIHLCPAHHLRHSMRFNTRQLTTAVIPWNTLHIAPGATLTTTADLTEHGHRYGHTLTARLACTDIPDTLATAALALRITLIDGTTLLMGTHHRPHPFITLTQDLTGHPADPSAPLLTATLTGKFDVFGLCEAVRADPLKFLGIDPKNVLADGVNY